MSTNLGPRTGPGPDRGAARSIRPAVRPEVTRSVHVDCGGCAVRGIACGDCVVTALLGAPPGGIELDPAEQAALRALADSGLVPPLRLVPGTRPGRSVPAPGWVEPS